MYSKNKDNKINLRLSEKQLAHLDNLAKLYSISRSDALRILIDMSIVEFEKKGVVQNEHI